MKKVSVDFTCVPLVDVEGNERPTNIAKALGNDLYVGAQDVAVAELGRKIYHAEGSVELSEDEVRTVRQAVQQWRWYVRSAVELALEAKHEE